jgi:hypothetical protein
LLAFFASGIFAQSDWDTYPVREIGTLVKQEQRLRDSSPKSDIVISADPFPSKTVITYLGSKRPAGKYARVFVKLWARSRGVPPENAEMLVDEYLFKENGVEYWLPVVKTIVDTLDNDLKPGDEVGIYYFYLGGFDPRALFNRDSDKEKIVVNKNEPFRWMFAVEKFEKKRATAFPNRSLSSLIDPSIVASKLDSEIWYDSRQPKAQAKLKFTGDVRDISGKRKSLVELWFEKNGFPKTAVSLMSREARFFDGDTEYWIGMRETTLNEIVSNVKKGDLVLLNTILAGGIKTPGGIDWFFLSGQYVH